MTELSAVLMHLLDSLFWRTIVGIYTIVFLIKVCLDVYNIPLNRQIRKLQLEKLQLEVGESNFVGKVRMTWSSK